MSQKDWHAHAAGCVCTRGPRNPEVLHHVDSCRFARGTAALVPAAGPVDQEPAFVPADEPLSPEEEEEMSLF